MVISGSEGLVTPFAGFNTEAEGRRFLRSISNNLMTLSPVLNHNIGITKCRILIADHITHTSYFSTEGSCKSITNTTITTTTTSTTTTITTTSTSGAKSAAIG